MRGIVLVWGFALLLAGCDRPAPDAPEADYQAAAQRWITQEFQPSTLTPDQQAAEMAWFIEAAAPFRGMEISVVSETLTTHEYEAEVLARAFRRDHRHPRDPRPHPGRRRHREAADPDAVGRERLRRLRQRLRPDRHPRPLRLRRAIVRFHVRRRRRCHAADAGRGRFHRPQLHHGSGRQAVSAAGSAVRQPLLVSLRLVPASGSPCALSRALRV